MENLKKSEVIKSAIKKHKPVKMKMVKKSKVVIKNVKKPSLIKNMVSVDKSEIIKTPVLKSKLNN